MLPDRGRLTVHDTNYVSSEGTSRLAIRGRDGVVVEGDDLPPDVADIPIRPVWQLSDLEERRTKQVEITFRGPSLGDPRGKRENNPITINTSQASRPDVFSSSSQLSRLLDRGSAGSWLGLMLIAARPGRDPRDPARPRQDPGVGDRPRAGGPLVPARLAWAG